MFGVAARWVLDTCRTVSEAVKFLERIPHARNTNFLITDATGEIAIVEASPAEVKTTVPSTKFGVVTNHFISESMREYEPVDADRSNSTTRHENLMNWIKNSPAKIGVDEIQHILADPANGVCACGSKSDSDPIETLWSWTIVLDSSEAYLADGRPDKNSYEPIRL